MIRREKKREKKRLRKLAEMETQKGASSELSPPDNSKDRGMDYGYAKHIHVGMESGSGGRIRITVSREMMAMEGFRIIFEPLV